MGALKAGDLAPGFSLKDQNGETVSLSDFKGKKLLLYFYPKANTPGCTKQSCSVRDALSELESEGVAAIGISPDAEAKQLNFDTKHSLGFPLLSDSEHHVAEAYGAYGEKKMYGKTYMGIIRSSFLINEAGEIMGAWYKVKPDQTVPNALELLS